MALKDIQSVLAKKKGSGGPTGPLMPSPVMGGGAEAPVAPPMDMGAGMPSPDMGAGTPPVAGDPQTMLQEGKQKVLEGLAEIKEAQAAMGGDQGGTPIGGGQIG